MFFCGEVLQSTGKWLGLVVFLLRSVTLIAVIISTGVGCTAVPIDSSQRMLTDNLAFGVIEVQSDGSNPRGYPTNVRFFFLTHVETQETFRIDVNSDSTVFSMRLQPGDYSVDRVQFHEGPFMAESHVPIEFTIPPKNAMWLGGWKFQLQTPRTIRMVRGHFLEGEPELSIKLLTYLVHEPISVETVLPNPESFEARVFSVAPIPKVKYFYR